MKLSIWTKLFVLLLVLWTGSILAVRVIIPERNPKLRHQGNILNVQADQILRRSCFDCHSNETRWSWYSYTPVFSVFIAHDIQKGRAELNFSKWNQFSLSMKQNAVKKLLEKIQKGKMPLSIYTKMYVNAKITDKELALLKKQAKLRWDVMLEEEKKPVIQKLKEKPVTHK